MKNSLLAIAALSAAVAGAPSIATGASPVGQDTFTLNIQGYVPVICRASLSSSEVATQSTEAPLGQLSEFCNDPNGYQVWVDYPQTLADASILVDGRRVNLSASGSTQISDSDHPSVEQHSLVLQLANPGVQGSISIRVVAL